MLRFAVVGHLARTSGDINLSDLPGGAGRMDVLCRCVNSAFFLSHEFRRDVECYLILCGDPDPEKTVRFSGSKVRYLSPDERSAGSLIKKALALPAGSAWRESTPGVEVRRGGLDLLLGEYPFAVLDETGIDLRKAGKLPEGYLLSDHQNFTPGEEALLAGREKYSAGPLSLHADHTITLVLNEIDRRRAGWTS